MVNESVIRELERLIETGCAAGDLSRDFAWCALKDARRVISAATDLSGDAQQALSCFSGHPISTFDSKTARKLVFEGRAEAVLDYLESLQAGSSG